MLLMVFWASLGLILGALGAFLGALLMFLRACGGTLHVQNFFFGTSSGYIYVFFMCSVAPLFEIIIFLLFEPLGVEFELSS